MRNKAAIVVIKIILLLFTTQFFSQEIIHNQANWFSYVGQYNVSPKLGYHIEASFRLDDELKMSNQNLFRLGGFYNLNKNATVTIGYGLINTFNKGLDEYFNEDRIWEQFQLNHKWKDNKNNFINRFRLEQRFVDDVQLKDDVVQKVATNYQNRLRYLNRHIIHLSNFKSGNEEMYLVLQDEIFVNIGDNKVNSKFFDQNRFLAGIGFNYKNSIRFEIAYMNQLLNSKSGSDVVNHTVSLTLLQNLIFYKE
jgi:hypothetical protein